MWVVHRHEDCFLFSEGWVVRIRRLNKAISDNQFRVSETVRLQPEGD